MVWDESTFELDNGQIKDLIRLADFRPKDVFYDIGSGTGNVVIEVAKHRGVKKSIGIELEQAPYERAHDSAAFLEEVAIRKKVHFWLGDLSFSDPERPEKYFYKLDDATVVYYSMDESLDTTAYFKKLFGKRQVRIITKNLPLVGYASTAIRANDKCWLFMMQYPLKRIRSLRQWTDSVNPGADIREVYDYYITQITKQYPGDEKYAKGNLLDFKRLINERFD